METTDRHPEIEHWESIPLENTDEGWGTLSNWVAEQSEDHSAPNESPVLCGHSQFVAAGIAALLFVAGVFGLTQFINSGHRASEETAISDVPEEMAEPPSTDIQNISPVLEEASDDTDLSKI